MLDTTPITTEIARLISTGTAERELLGGAPVSRADAQGVCGCPVGRDSPSSAGGETALTGNREYFF
jgi:hypothetical protein